MKAEFVKQKDKLDNLINQFTALPKNNFNINQDNINYGHSEQIKHAVKEMTNLLNFVSGKNK